MGQGIAPIEKLRRIWTPQREIEEVVGRLNPQSELDSMIRDFVHRIIEQKGPQTLILGFGSEPVLNTGTLRWEIIHHEMPNGVVGRREVSLWVEDKD